MAKVNEISYKIEGGAVYKMSVAMLDEMFVSNNK